MFLFDGWMRVYSQDTPTYCLPYHLMKTHPHQSCSEPCTTASPLPLQHHMLLDWQPKESVGHTARPNDHSWIFASKDRCHQVHVRDCSKVCFQHGRREAEKIQKLKHFIRTWGRRNGGDKNLGDTTKRSRVHIRRRNNQLFLTHVTSTYVTSSGCFSFQGSFNFPHINHGIRKYEFERKNAGSSQQVGLEGFTTQCSFWSWSEVTHL